MAQPVSVRRHRFGDILQTLGVGNYDAGMVGVGRMAEERGLAAEAPVIPCSAQLYNTAGEPARVRQRGENSDGARPPSGAAIVLYRTAQPYNTVRDRSRSAKEEREWVC